MNTNKLTGQNTTNLVVQVALAYAALGALGLALAIPPGYASPVFPASGLALACVLWFGRRALPGIWFGSVLLNVAQTWLHGSLNPTIVIVAVVIASGATLQAWVGSWLVNRWQGLAWRDLEREQDAFAFLLLGGGLACLLSASISVTGILVAGAIEPAEFVFNWWTWYVGDTLGVMVFAPLILCLLNGRGGLLGKQRRLTVIPLLLTLGLVALAFYGATRLEKQVQDNQLKVDGEIIAKQIADRMITHREVLTSLRNFIETIHDFNFEQFEHFTKITLQDNPDIFALSFNDLVTNSQRPAFEGMMSRLSPLGSFRITERDSQQQLIRAAARPEYVPVSYIVPLKHNKPALGFDIYSEPVRRDAINRAKTLNTMSVTLPIQLVQETKKRVGVLELLPVEAKPKTDAKGQASSVIGFAVSVVKVDEMVEIATRGHVADGLVFKLTDPGAPKGKELLYRSYADNIGSSPSDRSGNWKTMLRMGDRDWELSVHTTEKYRQQHRPWMAWAVGVVGLLFAALLQLLMLGITGRSAAIQSKNEAQKSQEVAEAASRAMEVRIAEEVSKNREKDSILLHQDKLASIGQLAAGVAHEINNPMGFIMSNLRTLKNYTEAEQQYLNALEEAVKICCPEEQRRQLEDLCHRLDVSFIQEDIPPLITESLEGAERVKRIVHDLKDFARADGDGMKETDLNHCVQSTANIVRNEIRYVADLELNLGEIPLIVCNPQQINQVIANLLVNAAHAIDGHGRITVSTSRGQDTVLLSVTDTGCGIPLDIQKRIFDPFFTTKEVGKGTGLGLSISYDIIKKHGGEITLEREPGLGTTFMIRLPISGPEEIKA